MSYPFLSLSLKYKSRVQTHILFSLFLQISSPLTWRVGGVGDCTRASPSNSSRGSCNRDCSSITTTARDTSTTAAATTTTTTTTTTTAQLHAATTTQQHLILQHTATVIHGGSNSTFATKVSSFVFSSSYFSVPGWA